MELIEKQKGLIIGLCNSYYYHEEDRKDAFQDVIVQLWKSFGTYRGESKISTWIYRVALNTLLNKVRKERKHVNPESIGADHMSLSSAYSDDYVELFRLLLSTLKDIDKAIVLLHLEGYKNREISEILGISDTNVTTRFHRIKSGLKGKFKKIYNET